MILKLFKSSNCPFCPRAIRIAETVVSFYDDVSLQVIDVRQDRLGVRDMNIRAVPTLAVDDQVIYVGSPTIDELDEKLKEIKRQTEKNGNGH